MKFPAQAPILAMVLALLAGNVSSQQPGLIDAVIAALNQNDFSRADQYIRSYRASIGVNSELLEAMSWMARAALDRKKYAEAEKYASDTYDLSVAQLKKRPLDREPRLPIALGAAIEVEATISAARGQRAEAVAYLQAQQKLYASTSIAARIRKNLLLLTLEGKPAPPLVGARLPRGKPALLFFWAHWCGDCKPEYPVLVRLKGEFAPKDLVLIAPTQTYGYAGNGQETSPEAERDYIAQIWQRYYPDLASIAMPISEANVMSYGASTLPTLVLIDKSGIVRLYHPGVMTYQELRPLVLRLLQPAP